MEQTIKDSTKDTGLGHSVQLNYVFLKGEKLVGALYVVTSFLPDSEPLKWRIRESGLDMVKTINSMKDIPAKNAVLLSDKLIMSVNTTLSLIEVALSGGTSVSQMNFSVLKQEFLSYRSSLAECNQPLVPEKVDSRPEAVNRPISRELPLIQKGIENKPKMAIGSSAVKKDDRQSLIKDFLRGKSWVPIGEIASQISGCSVKTIQRELTDLVNKGILQKKGDRRWSRYLLAA